MPWIDLGSELSDLFRQLTPTPEVIEEALWRRGQEDLARLVAFREDNAIRGGCSTCGAPRSANALLCQRCGDMNRERMKRGRRERLALDPGLCISCARQPRREGRTTCERCKQFNSSFLARRKADRRARGVCDVCGVNEPKKTATYCQGCHDKMRVRSRRQNKYQDPRQNPKRVRLSHETAMEIRARRAAGESLAALAARHGVSESTICRVVKGQIWRVTMGS